MPGFSIQPLLLNCRLGFLITAIGSCGGLAVGFVVDVLSQHLKALILATYAVAAVAFGCFGLALAGAGTIPWSSM